MPNPTEKPALLFCFERENRNSIGALLHSVETRGITDSLTIELCDFDSAPEVFTLRRETAPMIVAGFSLMTFQAEKVGKLLREIVPLKRSGDVFIAGGPHAAALPEESLRLGFDIVSLSEGEEMFPALLECFVSEKNPKKLSERLQSLHGIAWRDESAKIHKNPLVIAADLDTCWTCSPQHSITAPLEITRGCFFACKYCFTARFFARKVRHRSVKSAATLAGKYPKYVSFLSPNALSYGATKKWEVNVGRIVALLSGIKEAHPGIEISFGTFPSEVRPEYVSRELIREIKPFISNRYITIGAQSVSDSVLRAIAREHTVADIARAIDAIRSEGLDVLVDLILGLPGEQFSDVIETRRFIQRFIQPEVRFRIHRFTPLPGTPFADEPPGHVDTQTSELLLHYQKQGLVSGEW